MTKSYFHGGGTVPLSASCIGEALDAAAARVPDGLAAISRHQNVRLTYAELRAQAERFARGLLAMGVRKGDRVAIWASNGVEWLIVQYAAAKCGAILVTVNPAYGASELEFILRRAECRTLVMTPRFRDCDHVATLAAVTAPSLRDVILTTSLQDVLDLGAAVSQEELEAVEATLRFDDPINIQFTSGTTGSPKGVVLSHHNIINNAAVASRSMRFGCNDRICLPVPFFHCFGMVLGSVAAVLNGAAMVLPGDSFDADAVLHAIVEEQCTAVYGVPTMFIRELELVQRNAVALRSLRTGNIGGAPCPPALVRRIVDELHCPEITIGYGLTEASPLITQTTMDDPIELRLTSVGRPLPNTEVKIVDPLTQRIVDCGENGEICVRGYGVMKGYYNDDEATRKVIDAEGWLHTGDLATMDENGYCRIVGRIKDVIIRGGEKIHPREIEDLLLTHGAVSEAHVVGVPDPIYGESVAAWIKAEPGCSIAADEVAQFCRGKIAAFKIPHHIRIVNEFPTTVTGKIQKFRIREMASQEFAAAK